MGGFDLFVIKGGVNLCNNFVFMMDMFDVSMCVNM